MSRGITALCALIVCSVFVVSTASAQIIYEPVQYQYKAGTTYYYGGSDWRVHERARYPVSTDGRWGRVDGFAFHSGDLIRHRVVVTEPLRAYTDGLPFWNAAIFGFTPADARNEAYANVPRYWVKEDLVAAGYMTETGAIIVPAQAQPVSRGAIIIRPHGQGAEPPVRNQRPILIIPKRLLDQPLEQHKKVVIIPSQRKNAGS